jgi:HD-like signal output (HDOD) protein
VDPNRRKTFYKGPANVVYDIDGASCGMDERLVDAIRTAIQAKMKRQDLTIPRLPRVAGRILQLSQDPDVQVKDVTEAVMGDPLLAARVLRLSNSAAHGTAVETLDAAIMRLGMKKLRDLVFAESVRTKVFPARAYRSLLEQSWHLSLGAAVACEAIGRATGLIREGAFLIGLLHDIGKPTLVHTILEYERKNDNRPMGEELVELVLSQLHEETGAYVLEQWGMPEGAVAAARGHHLYQQAAPGAAAHRIIHAANLVCEHLGAGETQRDVSFNLERVFIELGLAEPAKVDPILQKISGDLENLMAGFEERTAGRA